MTEHTPVQKINGTICATCGEISRVTEDGGYYWYNVNCPRPQFQEFPKISRYSRNVIVTEKIDGTNAQVFVPDDPAAPLVAGSRTRWISPEDDNYGFARWVQSNSQDLRQLSPGHHYGEWWGAGIQRRYDRKVKAFSLFNVSRWADSRPACCSVVPVLWRGVFDELPLSEICNKLRTEGSVAAPGFMKPEGIVIFHEASGALFKKTLEKDEVPKGAVK